MEKIKGSQFISAKAGHTMQLNGDGKMVPLEANAVLDVSHPAWMHLNSNDPDNLQWINTTPLLPDSAREALAGKSQRPRISYLDHGVLLILRSVNNQTSIENMSQQLVSFRIYMTESYIISSCQQPVSTIDEIVNDYQVALTAFSVGEILAQIANTCVDHLNEFIEDLHELLLNIEDKVLEEQLPVQGELASLRKTLSILRRYLAPQYDMLMHLTSDQISWFSSSEQLHIQHIVERLGREIDDLDCCIARTKILADEISSIMSNSLNRRAYIMSLMAMLFLPLTFLTGLLGVNLGGIPGSQTDFAFSVFCITLFVLLLFIFYYLKKSKWL